MGKWLKKGIKRLPFALSITSLAAAVFFVSAMGIGVILWLFSAVTLLGLQIFHLTRTNWASRVSKLFFAQLSLILALAALVGVTAPDSLIHWFIIIVSVALLQITQLLTKVAPWSPYQADNIPGLIAPTVSLGYVRFLNIVNGITPLALFFVMNMALHPALAFVAPLLGLVLAGCVAWQAFAVLRGGERFAKNTVTALTSLAPDFVLYWSAPADSGYQLSMWVPYLERLGLPYAIVVRNKVSYKDAVIAANGAPVILAYSMRMVEASFVDSVKAVFYVNNSDKNTHSVRFSHLNHIQLLHGDSEKVSSFNPVTAMFDRVYVAGQAGIDRYRDNGINIPRERFEIVGRPQVEQVERQDGDPPASNPTVLYAPTWAGFYDDSSYSSLTMIDPVLQDLLQQHCRIIFRPHPFSAKNAVLRAAVEQIQHTLNTHRENTGIEHLWGATAETEMTLVDCFNASDMMIADISSVVTDYLYSGKPLAIMTGTSSPEEILKELPLARGAYLLAMAENTWKQRLEDMFNGDSLRPIRHSMRAHYLGDFAEHEYVDHFLQTARNDIFGLNTASER